MHLTARADLDVDQHHTVEYTASFGEADQKRSAPSAAFCARDTS